MKNIVQDVKLQMNYIYEPMQFPYENLDDYVSNPELRKKIAYDYFIFNFEEAIKKAFLFLADKLQQAQSSSEAKEINSAINPETLDMKLKGALLLLQCQSPESKMTATLHTLKFADTTLRLLQY